MRIVLPGAERQWTLDAMVELGAPSLLFSYPVLNRRPDRGLEALRQAKEAGAWVMVDSKAQTMRKKAAAKSKKGSLVKLEEQVQAYTEWAAAMARYVDVFSEVDLDYQVGERVWEWRRMLVDAVRGTSAEVLYTPHNGFDYKRIRDSGCSLVAVSKVKQMEALFTRDLGTLIDHQVRVHGWAITTYEAVVKWPLFSSTSNSWLLGSQFGTTFRYTGNCKLRNYSPERAYIRQEFSSEAQAAGVDFDRLVEADRYSVSRFNLSQWVLYAQDMLTYQINAYWMTHGERARDIEQQQLVWKTSEATTRHDFTKSLPIEDDPALDFGRYCNTCFMASKCPEYKVDATCPILARVSARDDPAVARILGTMVEFQAERVLFSSFVEKVSGIPLDDRVSRNMRRFREIVEAYGDTVPILDRPQAKPKGTVSKLLQDFAARRKKPGVTE